MITNICNKNRDEGMGGWGGCNYFRMHATNLIQIIMIENVYSPECLKHIPFLIYRMIYCSVQACRK